MLSKPHHGSTSDMALLLPYGLLVSVYCSPKPPLVSTGYFAHVWRFTGSGFHFHLGLDSINKSRRHLFHCTRLSFHASPAQFVEYRSRDSRDCYGRRRIADKKD
jgi:hypothetical protein